VGPQSKKSGGKRIDPMMAFRWFGLHCILLGLLACSTTPEDPALQHSKKPGGSLKPPAQNYVGLKIPPMPKGHETELGYLLGRLLYHDEKGRAHWEIIAALPPQPLPTGYHFSGGNCLTHNKPQPEIVAILRMEDKKTLTRVHKAWRANPQKETFEPLPLEGIQCINKGLNY
jgi:hypothetical protein